MKLSRLAVPKIHAVVAASKRMIRKGTLSQRQRATGDSQAERTPMAETAWAPNTYKPQARETVLRRRRPPRFRFTPHPMGAAQRRHRAIFISDVHLGTRGCKAEVLADFLARNSCDTLFLI